jgi:hypothetical protein
MIIEDNEPDSTDAEDEAEATSDDVDAIRAQRDATPSCWKLQHTHYSNHYSNPNP